MTTSPDIKIDVFETDSHEIKGITDDEAIRDLIRRYDFDGRAYQFEPNYLGESVDNALHYSFGYIIGDGSYQPIVTVLNECHPVRQIIDRQAVPV